MGKSFIKDFSWYFIGSIIPIAIGIIKTPIFTHHFDAADFGYLGIVTVSFSFLSMILFSWMSSCIWRFYPKYKFDKRLNELYSNLFFLFLVAFLVFFIISIFWYFTESNFLVKQLILYSFAHLFFNQLYQFYIIIIRLEGKSAYYTVFQSIRAIISLIIVLVQVFIFEAGIVALISSLLIVDIFAVLFLNFINPSKVSIKLKLSSKSNLKEILIYGGVGLLINLCFLIISSSDRYIIALLGNMDDVGIYDQVYKISQLSVAALVTIFFNTINPTLLIELERRFDNSKILIRQYLKVLVIFGLPFIFYLSFFSKEIATILLGENFRIGYTIMPYVFLAAYLQGISNFYELRLKFTNKLKKLSLIIGGATLLNILLTVFFVWLYGYKWAAITTVFTYIMLLFTFHLLDKELIVLKKSTFKTVFKLMFLFFVQGLMLILVNFFYEINLILKVILSIPFFILYYIFFKNQIKSFKLPYI